MQSSTSSSSRAWGIPCSQQQNCRQGVLQHRDRHERAASLPASPCANTAWDTGLPDCKHHDLFYTNCKACMRCHRGFSLILCWCSFIHDLWSLSVLYLWCTGASAVVCPLCKQAAGISPAPAPLRRIRIPALLQGCPAWGREPCQPAPPACAGPPGAAAGPDAAAAPSSEPCSKHRRPGLHEGALLPTSATGCCQLVTLSDRHKTEI